MKLAGPKWVVGSGSAMVLALAGALGVHYEGTRNTAYRDLGGVWTICQGHTRSVNAGDTATDDQCRQYLQADMGDAYAAVNRCITATLTVSQAAAFTDLAYNVGSGAVCGSTLQRLANAGDIAAACEQINAWNQVSGRMVQGLVNRRAQEYALCIGGVR